MHNIGILFVKMGRYGDAIKSFEYCMHEKASFRTGQYRSVLSVPHSFQSCPGCDLS